LCAAAACFALVGLFLRTTRRHRPILESLADHTYGIYLVHYVFVLWLQYILLGVALFAVAKAAIVFTGALALSWATTAAMCRLPIGARVMGRKSPALVRARSPGTNASLPGLTRQSIRFEKSSYEEGPRRRMRHARLGDMLVICYCEQTGARSSMLVGCRIPNGR